MFRIKLYILCWFLVFATACEKQKGNNIIPTEMLLTEFTFTQFSGGTSKYTLIYDHQVELTGMKLNDQVLFEIDEESPDELLFRVYFPDEEIFNFRVLVSPDGRILNMDDINIPFYSAGLDSIYGSIIFLSGMSSGLITSNYLSKDYQFTDDSITFHLAFTEMLSYPISFEEELRQGTAKWLFSNKKSPIPMPMQDLSFQGIWSDINESNFLQLLLYFLNLKGYYTSGPLSSLIWQKVFESNITRTITFSYEYNTDGYISKMQHSTWGAFEFTYSE